MPADISCRGCGQVFAAKRSDALWCAECRKANAKEYVRLYDAKITHPCLDCPSLIGRNAKRCRRCDNKWRSVRYRGEGSPNWKQGRTLNQGYVMVRTTPDTHRKGGGAYEREHRVVWERRFGPLPKGHIIHHLNGIKHDNRIENLAAMSRSEHHVRHAEPYEERIRELEAQLGLLPMDQKDFDALLEAIVQGEVTEAPSGLSGEQQQIVAQALERAVQRRAPVKEAKAPVAEAAEAVPSVPPAPARGRNPLRRK